MPRIVEPRKIRGQVFRAMGVADKNALAKSSRKDIQRHFEPYAKREYPSRMSSDKSRVPMEFGARQWGHMEFMERALKTPELARQIAKDPLARREFERAMFDALQERALKAYAEEWRALSPRAIETLIGRAKASGPKPTPTLANEHNARMVASDVMQRLRKQKTVTIVDLGCGGGGTIMPIINSIPKEHRHRVNVILVDVMGKGLKSTKQKLMRRGLIGKGQVVAVPANISKLMESDKIASYFGSADIVTSGAALHHVAAIEPTFNGVKRLLKKGGSFIFWDWGHTAWRAPNLVIAPQGARVDKYGQYYSQGRRTVEAPKQTAFISREKISGVTQGRAPREIETVRSMLSTWVSLLHFPAQRKAEFLDWFDKKVRVGAPINFGEYLKKLEGKALDKGMPGAEIKYWEGHRPPELYHDAMRGVGLISEKTRPFTMYSTESPLLYQMHVTKE